MVSSVMVLDARTIAVAEELINSNCFAFNKLSNKPTAFLTNSNTEHATAVPPLLSNSFRGDSWVLSVWLHGVPCQWVDPAAEECVCQDNIQVAQFPDQTYLVIGQSKLAPWRERPESELG